MNHIQLKSSVVFKPKENTTIEQALIATYKFIQRSEIKECTLEYKQFTFNIDKNFNIVNNLKIINITSV